MNRTPQSHHRRSRAPALLAAVVACAAQWLVATPSTAQDRIDPRHPSVAYMQEWGTMDGMNLQCLPGWGEALGKNIIPVLDLNNDGIGEFILERNRCDTAFPPNGLQQGNELLLFYGVKNKLPKPEDGVRIGPTEIGSQTTFLGMGDFDDDTNPDLLCRIEIIDDTSFGNINADYHIAALVVFWGNTDSQYSLQDTSHLPCDTQTWLGGRQGIVQDFTGDGIADALLTTSGSGFSNGKLVPVPKLYVFAGGKGNRWREGIGNTPVQRWWSPPAHSWIEYRDHDCSGEKDIIFHDKGSLVEKISIAYQQDASPWLDTTDIEMIDLWKANGRFVLFQDVSGDNVLDLVLIGGDFSNQRIKVFAGKAGQRLREQYGDGWDSADIANKRFPLRPWVNMPTPTVLHDGWFGCEHVLFDVGDLNGDSTAEIVTHTDPFIIIYTTGRTLDSLIDVMVNIPADSWGTFRRLGDIDGSGTASFAASWNGKVHFMKAPPADEIPTYGGRLRDLPHPIDFRCALSSGVNNQEIDSKEQNVEMDLSTTSSDAHGAKKTALAPRTTHTPQSEEYQP